MDFSEVLAHLRKERDAIDAAIRSLDPQAPRPPTHLSLERPRQRYESRALAARCNRRSLTVAARQPAESTEPRT